MSYELNIWDRAHMQMFADRKECCKNGFNQEEYDAMLIKQAKLRGSWSRLKIAADKPKQVQLKFIDFLGGVLPDVN